MSTREKFEAWMKERFADSDTTGFAPVMFVAWQAARAEALEEAAKLCDDYAVDRWNLYKGRAPYSGSEPQRADSYTEGQSDGADICGEKIRALAKLEGE